MLNRQIALGDAKGTGHEITITPFEDGSVVIAAYNPDDGCHQRVVLLPDQWQAAIRVIIGAYGADLCPYNEYPLKCLVERDRLEL